MPEDESPAPAGDIEVTGNRGEFMTNTVVTAKVIDWIGTKGEIIGEETLPRFTRLHSIGTNIDDPPEGFSPNVYSLHLPSEKLMSEYDSRLIELIIPCDTTLINHWFDGDF